jgi:hypothetical protein
VKDQPLTPLSLILKHDNLSVMVPILQEGFRVAAKVGCDIQSLLCDQFGLRPDYLADRISTIFLNGKPLDNVAAAVIKDGATLALSAAMPGLVGATFRKSGSLAALRKSITYSTPDDTPATGHDGFVTIKLFNLLTSELGPLFLKRGIWVRGRDLRDALGSHPSDMHTIFKKIEKDGHCMDLEQVADLEWISMDACIFLRATGEIQGPGKTETG